MQIPLGVYSSDEGPWTGAASITLLDYPDGSLAGVPACELAGHVAAATVRVGAGGMLVFDGTGVTGHPDHQAATRAAVLAGRRAGLPVLAWTLPAAVLWRRLQLLGECEHLRWLVPPAETIR